MIKIFVYQLLFFHFFYLIFRKIKFFNKFLDDDFKKKQSFHTEPTPRYGGILIFLSFAISLYLTREISTLYSVVLFFVLTNVVLGTLDDIRLIFNPISKFCIFLILNISLIFFFDLKIKQFDVFFLDYLNNNIYFSVIITFISIFFVINGSNLIDGFNGLLGIHSFLIVVVLTSVTYDQLDPDILLINYAFMLSVCIFLFYNIPKAKIFLGDGGSFFIGCFISTIIIAIYNLSENISPFFFAILIYYLFFEIFFSVFRKIAQKKNPFYPDRKHLHMLLYQYLKLSNINFNNYNFLTSLIINFFYLITVIPTFLFFDNNLICQIYFFILISIYLFIYFYLTNYIKKNAKSD
tara:strand:+ start:568 stop:1617 length:1050 start_codon:yes stop_codon:yes gene_type:complete